MPWDTPSPTDASCEAEHSGVDNPHGDTGDKRSGAGEVAGERASESMLSGGRGRGGAERPGGAVEMTTFPHNFSPSRDFLSGFYVRVPGRQGSKRGSQFRRIRGGGVRMGGFRVKVVLRGTW